MLDPKTIYERLVETGDAWSDANAAADILEETKKIELARLGDEHEGSQAAKESHALKHPKYREHVAKMVEARNRANKARVKYESAKMWAELLRTQAATERAANRNAV